jgi:hypothetical protein
MKMEKKKKKNWRKILWRNSQIPDRVSVLASRSEGATEIKNKPTRKTFIKRSKTDKKCNIT